MLSLLFLWRAGELSSYSEIARRQQETGAIWGSALNGDDHRYALEVVRARKPEVMVLGSSRALQFHQEAFTRPFADAALGMQTLSEGKEFLGEVLQTERPKVLLLALDFWWFNEAMPEPQYKPLGDAAPHEITRTKVAAPYAWLWQRKVSLRQFVQIIIQGAPKDRIGVGTIVDVNGNGRLPDGSAGKLATRPDHPAPDRFDETLDRVRNRTVQFQQPGIGPGDRMAALENLVRQARGEGMQVVLLLGPVPPPVLGAMQASGDDYSYIEDLKAGLRNTGVEYYDFLTPSALNRDPADYYDGLHGGQRLYDALLLSILETNPRSALVPYLNRDWLAQDNARLARPGA